MPRAWNERVRHGPPITGVAVVAATLFVIGTASGFSPSTALTDPADPLSIWLCLGEPLGLVKSLPGDLQEPVCGLLETTAGRAEEDVRQMLTTMTPDGEAERVLLGILFQHCSYNGCADNRQKFPTEARFYGTPPACETGLYYEFPKFKRGWPKGFNDEVSSVDGGYSGCNSTVLFEHTDFGGRSYVCTGDCAKLAAVNFNDIASSATFTPN